MKCLSFILLFLYSNLLAMPAGAASKTDFDSIWKFTNLYSNENNSVMQGFALSGRLQADATSFDADEGDFEDVSWRRLRFGFKSRVFEYWVVQLEGDFDLNEGLGDSYTRLTDASISWLFNKNSSLKFLKQSARFTLDGATSSKKLLTLQRSNLTNNLWFTAEYFTGVTISSKQPQNNWQYNVGVFSSDGSDELSKFEAGYFTLITLGYDFASRLGVEEATLTLDYVYNDQNSEANTRDFSEVISLRSQWQRGHWGMWSDIAFGRGFDLQSNIQALALMPFYNISERLQLVTRYTYVHSSGINGVRLGRYENKITAGRGDKYNEVYAGLNVFFYGHKLKWQTGLEYAELVDRANDGGEYKGWGITTGLRLSW